MFNSKTRARYRTSRFQTTNSIMSRTSKRETPDAELLKNYENFKAVENALNQKHDILKMDIEVLLWVQNQIFASTFRRQMKLWGHVLFIASKFRFATSRHNQFISTHVKSTSLQTVPNIINRTFNFDAMNEASANTFLIKSAWLLK